MDGRGEADGAVAPPPEIAWADPARAIHDLDDWRRRAADGVPVGGDPYSAYCAEDGSLPLWPLAAVLSEARLAREFVEETLGLAYAGLRVPGPSTECAEGDFLAALMGVEPEVRLGLPKLG